jgi:type IV secretion system protein VirB10
MKRLTGDDPRTLMPPEALSEARMAGMPQVAVRGDSGMAIGAAIAVGLGVLAFSQLNHARVERVAETPAPINASDNSPPRIEPPPAQEPPPAYRIAVAPIAQDRDDMVRPERLRTPSLVYDAGPAMGEAQTAPGAAAAAGATAAEQFAARIATSENAPATATDIGDLSATVIEGTILSGVLETAINSDLPGFTRAIVSEDVRSFDGTEILIPRGSRLIGQYRSGLAVGESRAFVVWTRLVLPNGIAIKLASPVTDTLGRAGLGGKVDRHFLQRFGSALLLSIIGVGGELLAAQSNSSQIVINSSGEAYGIAQAALEGSVNIPPTIRIPQGAPIRIFVARDLIFPLYEESGGVALTSEP